MLIKNANENTNGEVTCRAIGKDNIFAEDSALIFVNDNRILLKIQPQESIVQIGSDINLSCDIIQPNIGDLENLTYVWSKDSIILNDFNQRQFNFRTKSLNESGLYSCQVFDGDRKSEPSNSNIKVIPNPNSITIISNHKIDYNNSKLVVKESDSVNLKCEAEADDNQVHWNINSTLNGLSQKFGKELFLNSILQNQSGNYECVVKKPQVEKELRYAINVYAVKYEPLIIEINTSYLKNILRLDCNVVQGLPSPKISWTKDGLEIDNLIEEMKTFFLHSISIDQTNKDNIGTFKCTADNDLENVQQEFHFGIDHSKN